MREVWILGRGLASVTAAWLLCEKGLQPVICGPLSRSARRIALNPSTVELIETLFGIHPAANESAQDLHRRSLIGWDDQPDSSQAWPSLAIDAEALSAELDQRLIQRFGDQVTFATESPAPDSALVIDTLGPHHPHYRHQAGRLTFGRRASAACTLRTARPRDEVLIERTADSWLFLLPTRRNDWTLYVVTAVPDSEPDDTVTKAIDASSLRGQIVDRTPAETWSSIAPILHHPLATANFLRAGEAAFTFDPLCGDGVGYSIRSAILAATVAADVMHQEFRGLEYYQFRLSRAFRAHLEACCQYYDGWNTPDWRQEVESMNRGIAFLQSAIPSDRLTALGDPRWEW